MKFGFDWPSSFREEGHGFKIMVMHMNIALGQGQTATWGQTLFKNINLQLI